MKKVTAVILSVVLIMGLIVMPASANDIEVAIYGTKTDSQANFIVSMANLSGKEKDVDVYVVSYNSGGIATNVKKHDVVLDANSKTALLYNADITSTDAKIFVWEKSIRPLVESLSSRDCTKEVPKEEERITIDADDIWASRVPESQNMPSNAVDGDLATKWTVNDTSEENPESLIAYLSGDYNLTRVGIAFGKGAERSYVFKVSVSEDGENFTTLVPKRNNKRTNDVQYFTVAPIRARYLRVTCMGRSDAVTNIWTQINEIEAYGYKDKSGVYLMENAEADLSEWTVSEMDEMSFTGYTPSLGEKLYAKETDEGILIYDRVTRSGRVDLGKLNMSEITASQTPEESNSPDNVTDGDLTTIWTAANVTDEAPAHIITALEKSCFVSKVGIGFDKGNERTYSFDVSVSTDGESFKTVVERSTSAQTNDIQYFEFKETEAAFIKYTFYKRLDASDNGWVRISEIESYGSEKPIEGAGGILVQRELELPSNGEDFEISFEIDFSSKISGESASCYYSGISLTDKPISGGADLDGFAAMQLRFDDSDGKVKINKIVSNYFNEGYPAALFENTFNKDEKVSFSLKVFPRSRKIYVTAKDSEKEETRLLYFAYSDAEKTRSSTWEEIEADTLVFNSGAGAKGQMTVSDVNVRRIDTDLRSLDGEEPVNGIIRLEAVRLSDYPTSSGDYYGRYIYHSGEDEAINVKADINPAQTRFVERRGLIGTGVSLEAVTKPGYFVCEENGSFVLKKLEDSGVFYKNATFYKEEAENIGYYTGETYSYRLYGDKNKYLYDTTKDKKTGALKPSEKTVDAQGIFYLKNEAEEYVCDNFYGDKLSDQWWNNYPWKKKDPVNDSYNFTALITKKNVIVENGELFLKATKATGWPSNANGETGITYNKWGKGWEKWKGYVGVVSIQDKVFNRQCFVEGSFKQADSPIGYWNAFWLTGRDSWPPEIDIFETLSSSYGPYTWNTTLHGKNDTNNIGNKFTKSANLNTDYHVFSMDWGYDYIKFYLDGTIYMRYQNHDTVNFQKNMRLILNTGIGGWEAEPDETMVWDEGLRCKYVRCFQY